ncbi:hypothetical protein BAUCODRAFT_145634 [Baudoinia panamericana UAMH 10762]|uniref:Small ribosomal subunit protein mS38 n=1 Tax=Baudoinia panamericana (strain UAMH 10762) TaxID=717646 RepID=M2NHP8_BAUPA|nr:uncharacterized protein BAUCODRAFT_145634 [Baudoinia panamericana UAMH 10762]EMC98565.1 hypothetical protein BAUCODRAFT_145634 [Baudoinia panamericana UAMH 10762]
MDQGTELARYRRRLSASTSVVSPTTSTPSHHTTLPHPPPPYCPAVDEMFSTRLTRVVNRAAATPVVSSPTASTTAHRTTQCLCTRPAHQRRQSSSKVSYPPNSSKPSPAAKATSSSDNTSQPRQSLTGRGQASAATARPVKRHGKRSRLHGLVAERISKGKVPIDQFARLPSVPGVSHLTEKGAQSLPSQLYVANRFQLDLGFANFFSLHRPISVTTTIPPPSTSEAFNNLFETKHQRDPWENGNSAERRPEDVIFTLHNTIEALENHAQNEREDGVRWEVIQESSTNSDNGVKHLDGPPRQSRSLEDLVTQFRPYRAPPPPQPFPEENSKAAEKKQARGQRRQHQLVIRPQQKSYQTTITVLEVTSANGQKSYTASSSPIVAIPDPTDAAATIVQAVNGLHQQAEHMEPRIRLPFLERMRRRQRLYTQAQQARLDGEQRGFGTVRRAPSARRVKMILISVKRQRKLKMKKHKYKKLMKRNKQKPRTITAAQQLDESTMIQYIYNSRNCAAIAMSVNVDPRHIPQSDFQVRTELVNRIEELRIDDKDYKPIEDSEDILKEEE